ERQRYWSTLHDPSAVAIPTEPSVVPAEHEDVADWFAVPTWRESPVVSTPLDGLAGQAWVIFDDADGVGPALLDALRAAGARAFAVRPGDAYARVSPDVFTIRAEVREDYERVVAALVADGAAPTRLVHAWGAARPSGPGNDHF